MNVNKSHSREYKKLKSYLFNIYFILHHTYIDFLLCIGCLLPVLLRCEKIEAKSRFAFIKDKTHETNARQLDLFFIL
jgi:hypothetical protein